MSQFSNPSPGGEGGGTPSDSVAALTGAGAAGSSEEYSRGDHRHGDTNRPTDGEKAALPGTSGAPGAGNKYVTDADPRNSDARTPTAHGHVKADISDFAHTHVKADVTDFAHAHLAADLPDATTAAKGIVELATSGENAAGVAVQGNDARLSDARTPTAHSIIGAEHNGFPGGTTNFLRADGAFAAPPAGGGNPVYAPGSFTLANGEFKVMAEELFLDSTDEALLEGDSTLVII